MEELASRQQQPKPANLTELVRSSYQVGFVCVVGFGAGRGGGRGRCPGVGWPGGNGRACRCFKVRVVIQVSRPLTHHLSQHVHCVSAPGPAPPPPHPNPNPLVFMCTYADALQILTGSPWLLPRPLYVLAQQSMFGGHATMYSVQAKQQEQLQDELSAVSTAAYECRSCGLSGRVWGGWGGGRGTGAAALPLPRCSLADQRGWWSLHAHHPNLPLPLPVLLAYAWAKPQFAGRVPATTSMPPCTQ